MMAEDGNDCLDWRMDPEESFSDWTIEITCKHQQGTNAAKKQKTTKNVYHVHKNILAFGSRSSEYFARMFRSKHFQEAESSTCCIELHELALEAFPSMLDYLYKPTEQLAVTPETATALHSLGEYFGMSRLQRNVEKFVKRDPDIANYGTYYGHASALNSEKVMKYVEDLCVENSDEIEMLDMVVKVAKPNFWLNVFRRDCEECNSYSSLIGEEDEFLKHVSRLVAEICHQHKDTMDAEMFRALTDVELTPLICPDAALRLLEFESRFVASGDAKLSSLQERCIESLVKNWQTVDFSNVLQVLETQRPTLLAQLLAKTVGRAKHDLNEVVNAIE